MNIVDAYIKFNKQLIILISGLSGSGKTTIASFIERDFKIKHLNIDNYCKKDFEKYVEVSEGIKINDWDDIDSYDWNAFNEDVNKNKTNGLVICGSYFPTDKLKFTQDFHIHVKISKQKLIESRHNFIKENPEKCKELVQFLDTPTESLIINKIVYPHYLDYSQKSKIDKYINANELTIDSIYDASADFLFNKISQFLTEYNNKLIEERNSKPTVKNNSHDKSINKKKVIEDGLENYDIDENAIYLGRTDYN